MIVITNRSQNKSYNKMGYAIDQSVQVKSILDEDDADLISDVGYKNEVINLSDDELLANIQHLQNENNIKRQSVCSIK